MRRLRLISARATRPARGDGGAWRTGAHRRERRLGGGALSADDIADLNRLVETIGAAGNRYDDAGMSAV